MTENHFEIFSPKFSLSEKSLRLPKMDLWACKTIFVKIFSQLHGAEKHLRSFSQFLRKLSSVPQDQKTINENHLRTVSLTETIWKQKKWEKIIFSKTFSNLWKVPLWRKNRTWHLMLAKRFGPVKNRMGELCLKKLPKKVAWFRKIPKCLWFPLYFCKHKKLV